MDQVFSISKLWPNFEVLLQSDPFSTPEGFSSGIVALLFLLFTAFFLIAVRYFVTALFAVRFYRDLLKKAGFDNNPDTEFDPSSVVPKRRDLLHDALQEPKYGRLWREFDESLVSSPDGSGLSNTLDASHFFNTHTLARGLTESRLMAAVPGFLTAIGVIGTFAGLQLGLANLNLEDSQDVQQIKQGIGAVTSGAAIAFMTSLWGVFTSVVFNFLEKLLERSVRSSIAQLQDHIDYLYPRITAEQSLIRIADSSQRGHDSLQGLAEKIGNRMQEAMTQATSAMSQELQDALNNILAPAVDSLVSNANGTSERALTNLVSNFSKQLGEAGSQQHEMMVEATNQMNVATENLAQQLSQFSESATSQKTEMAETFEGLLGQFVNKFEALNQAASEREQERHRSLQGELQLAHEANQQAVGTLLADVEGQLTRMGERDQQRSEALGSTQDELVRSVAQLINSQKLVHNDIIQQLRDIQSRYDESITAQQDSSNAIRSSATQMQDVSAQIGQLGTTLQQSSAALGESVGSAAALTKDIVDQNEHISQTLKTLGASYIEISNTMESVTAKLNAASQHAQAGFEAVDANLDKFKEQMAEQVRELENHISKLMEQFAEQVKVTSADRMTAWNEQTSAYTAAMTNAVQTLAGVVDEMEQKLGSID